MSDADRPSTNTGARLTRMNVSSPDHPQTQTASANSLGSSCQTLIGRGLPTLKSGWLSRITHHWFDEDFSLPPDLDDQSSSSDTITILRGQDASPQLRTMDGAG